MNESDVNSTYSKLQTGEVHIYPEVGTRHATRSGDGEVSAHCKRCAIPCRCGDQSRKPNMCSMSSTPSRIRFIHTSFPFPLASVRTAPPTIDVMWSRLRVQVQRCGQLGILAQNG